jgi:maltooligosyltrehalose trehalohydrolase
LFVNLGRDLNRRSIPDPLVAPPGSRVWQLAWSSEHPDYGGAGTPEPETPERWRIPGETALVMAAVSQS